MGIIETQNVTEDELIKKAVAPRVTMKDIKDNIVSEYYFTAHQGARASFLDKCVMKGEDPRPVLKLAPELGLLTICVLVLKNGFTVLGKSACASAENFNEELGQQIAREDAVDQMWALMGYELRSRLKQENQNG